jgi:iron complex outermembrane receptor protein
MLLDLRTRNVGNAKIEGLDYSARYDFSTPIGDAYVTANGTVDLVNRRQSVPGAPFVNTIVNQPNHRVSINAGLRSGGFRTQLTLNHTDGYKVTRSADLLQDSVGSYDLVNAFFSYQFAQGELGLPRIMEGLEVTLNIQNILDDSPPLLRQRGSQGYTNGGTLGRLIQLGATIDF